MNNRKNKWLIIKRHVLLRGIKQQRRKNRKKRKKNLKVEPAKIVGVPRNFRRVKRSKLNRIVDHSRKELLLKKEQLINNFLSVNLKYLLQNPESPLNLKAILKENYSSHGVINVPEEFSVLDKPKESYQTLKKLVSALFIENSYTVILNYEHCKRVELSSQILLDIILKDFWALSTKCHQLGRNYQNFFPSVIGGKNINEIEIQKLLFSVGSPAILGIEEKNFTDVEKYKLCVYDNQKETDLQRRIEQKEIDTTLMADYVKRCLKRMNKELTGDKMNDLCTVIGEILINAEEHSTTNFRFSIGYFKEDSREGNHFGIFKLVILNFGRTIYEKFKAEDCPNRDIVEKMKSLSQSYTSRKLFRNREFEEENLWTLYALQEGVTSIPYGEYKRGNGSIRFIESFFNIKGSQEADNVSRLSIVSGKTRIVFDGTYNITPKTNLNGDTFKVMTFNDSSNIEEKPDSNFVFCIDDYFPGTLISAKILLNDDDLNHLKN